MSRLEIPLLARKLWATGDVLLRAEVELLLKDDSGNWSRETFRVDSGAEMTTMPAFRARQCGLPMPQKPVPGATHKQTGLEFRAGYLRAVVLGLDQTEFSIPCFFLGDPSTLPAPNTASAAIPRNLLGLTGVIDQLSWQFDGQPTIGALYGMLVIEKMSP